MNLLHYLDGKWVETKDLKISVLDLSVLRGYGVFDFLRTYNSRPLLLKEHIDRLFNSAKALELAIPHSKEEVGKIITQGIDKNKKVFKDFNIRIVVTGGVGVESTIPGKPSFIVIFSEAIDYPKDYFEKGVKLVTYNAKRIFPEAKTINYLIGILALQKAKQENAVEALYIDNTNIYECITSNFFAVIDNKLITPKKDILIGVTRGLVLQIAKEKKIKVVERPIRLKELPIFQEAFITASNKEVMPVVKIDNKQVGNGKVGPITNQLLVSYREIIRSL